MNPNPPNTAWRVLAFFSPGIVSLLFTAFGKICLSRENEIGASMLGLPVAFLMCLVFGWLIAKWSRAGNVVAKSFLFIFLMLIVNFSIAVGGCAVMQPYFDIK